VERGNLPDRQRTLRATLDWSYGLLDVHERLFFARLAVFVGGWTLEAAEPVCDVGDEVEVLRHMSALVDKSLAQQTNVRHEPRFTMLETVREYALERLEESGELDRLCRRHAGYFLELAEEERASQGPLQGAWLDRLETEHDNLRAALAWSLSPPGRYGNGPTVNRCSFSLLVYARTSQRVPYVAAERCSGVATPLLRVPRRSSSPDGWPSSRVSLYWLTRWRRKA
jgi:predicted ATPase